MKKYWSVFRIRFLHSLQYRAAALAGVATQFAWGGMEILAFRAFYQADPAAFPMEFSQLSSYIWLQQALLASFAVWFYDSDILQSITSGDIAYELVRPVKLYDLWFAKNAGTRLSKTVMRCLPIFLVAGLLPQPWGLRLPQSWGVLGLTLLSILMGFVVVVSMVMLVYISGIHTINSMGTRILLASLSELLGGAVIPLPFFPDGIRQAVELLPFAAGQNVPLRIYSGSLAGPEMWKALALQCFWMVALVLLGRVWMRASMRKITVQGG